jgi:SAM-dependent methyltransferase
MVKDLYKDGTYLQNNPNWHQEESSWKAKQVLEVIKRNNVHLSTICDVGCGAGGVLRVLSERLPDTITYCGYDISPQAIALCSKMGECNISFHLGDLLEEDKMFDMVLGLDVVEHVEDYIGFLRKLKTKARYKLLHLPLDLAVQRVLRISTIIMDMEHVGHLHFFTKETALAALKLADYKIIESSLIAKRVDLRMGGKKARFLTVPRKLLFSINKELAARVFGGWSLSVLAE